MKDFFYKLIYGALILILLPILLTMVFHGGGGFLGEADTEAKDSGRTDETFDEGLLLGIVAKEIDAGAEIEAIKAQCVIARTNYMRAKNKGEDLPEGLSQSELGELWGGQSYTDNLNRLEACVQKTKGQVLVYAGECIEADYHAVSAGHTRTAKEALKSDKYPYLSSVDSMWDIPSKEYLKVTFFTLEEFTAGCNGLLSANLKEGEGAFTIQGSTPQELTAQVAVSERDSSGYAVEIKIGEKTINGEQFRKEFALPSSCLYISPVGEQIRIVTKGLGHGFGLSLYGANKMAEDGADYTKILAYYFKDTKIISPNE